MNDGVSKDKKCSNCGKSFGAQFDVCPFCGVITNSKPDGERLIKSNKKKAWVLAAAVSLPLIIALVIVSIKGFSPLPSKKNFSQAELTDIYDDLNYSALTATMQYRFKAIKNGYTTDADKDGRKELFLEIESEQYPEKQTVLAFDTIENPIMSSATQNGAAGGVSIKLSSDNSAVLQWGYYSIGATENVIEKWSDSGWERIGEFSGHSDENDEFVVEKAYLNGEEFDTEDEFNSEFDKLGIDEHKEHYGKLLSKYYSTGNGGALAEKYSQYLSDKFDKNYFFQTDDFDGDGENEYVYIIESFADAWRNNLETEGTDGFIMEEYLGGLANTGTVCIYADVGKNGVVFHTFIADNLEFADFNDDNNVDISWNDGELEVVIKPTESDEFICENLFFCMNADLSDEKNFSDDSYEKIGKMFTSFLKRNYYSDVISKFADLSDSPINELVCVCGDSSEYYVSDWITKIYTVVNGRMINIYEQNPEKDGAVFITEENGGSQLLFYNQSVFRNGSRNGNSYAFSLECFDKSYDLKKLKQNTVILYYDETPTEEKSRFFTEFNEYLNNATVCVDRYELTGYARMTNDDSEYFESDGEKYLSISNCSTNKTGTVDVDEGSWLNFRDGASTANEKILLNANDPDSFVKQIRGSAVTVIDTVNIEDAENPIWLEIQIKYAEQTLTGFSSKRFIDLSQIKHLSVGDKFTVTAKTNDKNLEWSSNDSNVLTVDADTGEVKAKKQGLALVKVISDSGLEDSCLIMVD